MPLISPLMQCPNVRRETTVALSQHLNVVACAFLDVKIVPWENI